MKNILVFVMLATLFFSCETGKVTYFPNTFSQLDIRFGKEGGDTTIVSQSDEWDFGDYLELNNEPVRYPRCEKVFPNTEPVVKRAGTCSDDVLTVKYDFMRTYLEAIQVTGNWFALTKTTLKEANIKVGPNTSGEIRTVRVTVDKGGTTIVIRQSAE